MDLEYSIFLFWDKVRFVMFKFFIKLIAIISLGCSLSHANLGDLGEDDLEHSTVTQGKSALQEEDWEGAITFFEKALEFMLLYLISIKSKP